MEKPGGNCIGEVRLFFHLDIYRPYHLDNIQAFACLLVKKSYAVL